MKLSLIGCGAIVACALAFAPGCSSSEANDGNGPVGFAAEAPATGATVFLRGRESGPVATRIVVDVVARGAADLHGAAFRVTWDPTALAFVEASSGPTWSKQVLAMAKEGAPGQLAVAWTEKGEAGIDATAETVIGTLTFESRGNKATPLAFKTERAQIVDKRGVRVEVAWRGGNIGPR
jgi:hypothetical protein